MISDVFFYIFYIIFRCLDIFATIFEIILMNELKNRFLSRMLRVIIDNSFKIIILQKLSKKLTNLNNRQRYYFKFRAFNKINIIIILKITISTLSNIIHLMNIVSTIMIKTIFKITRENTSLSTIQRKRISFTQHLSKFAEIITYYDCDKIEHVVKNCFEKYKK